MVYKYCQAQLKSLNSILKVSIQKLAVRNIRLISIVVLHRRLFLHCRNIQWNCTSVKIAEKMQWNRTSMKIFYCIFASIRTKNVVKMKKTSWKALKSQIMLNTIRIKSSVNKQQPCTGLTLNTKGHLPKVSANRVLLISSIIANRLAEIQRFGYLMKSRHFLIYILCSQVCPDLATPNERRQSKYQYQLDYL